MHIPNKFDRNSRERDVYQTLNLKSNILSPSERKEKTNNREEERAVRAGQNFMNRICLDKVLFIFFMYKYIQEKKRKQNTSIFWACAFRNQRIRVDSVRSSLV